MVIIMSFKELLKKIQGSKEFKEFKEKNRKAFLFSAFFVLTPDFSIETQQIDFYMPEKKKVATFFIEDKIIKNKIEDFEPKDKITALDEKIKIDILEVSEIIKKEIEKQKLQSFDINKNIVILQKIKFQKLKTKEKEKEQEQQIWNITCLLSSFKILRLHIDCFSGKILDSKQENMLDFVQVKSNK